MKKFVIVLLLILTTFSVDGIAQFTEIKRIQLPENHLIGGVKSLDVLGNSFLITDMREQVFLYEIGSDQLISLNPENCFPGFDFKPIHTFHLADSSIFLINATLPGYRFEADGSCKGSVHKDFTQVPLQKLAVDEMNEDYFYTLRTFPNRPLKYRKYQHTGRLVEEAELIEPEFPEFNYRFEGGGTAVHGNILYYILSSGAWVYRFDIQNNRHLKKIRFEPEYRSPTDSDITADPFSPQMIKDITAILDDHYIVSDMSKLSEKYLLIQTHYREGKESKYRVHLYNLESNSLEEEEFIFERPFSFVRNNKAYRVTDEREEDENVLNPGIVVYEFKGNE